MKESVLNILGGRLLIDDCLRYKQLRNVGIFSLLIKYPEFRYQFFYRMRTHSGIWRLLLKPISFVNSLNLYFNCNDIGGGLFVEHGFSTVIACKHIGENCWINQQVTIGYGNKSDSPSIGNYVQIKAGAKVIGNVIIGDDVIIGANAVVVKNVPSHTIVGGVPAKIIKRRSSMDDSWRRVDENESEL